MGARVAILGLGNVLMGDDALGPTVIGTLAARYQFPESVEVHDLGTPGLDLHPHLVDRDLIVLVDVVRSDGAPGSVRTYDKAALLRHPPQARTSPHDPGVKESLLALEFLGGAPAEVILVGVVPGEVGYEVGLTPGVRAAIPEVVGRILAVLRERGIDPVARENPREPEPWWEAPASVLRAS